MYHRMGLCVYLSFTSDSKQESTLTVNFLREEKKNLETQKKSHVWTLMVPSLMAVKGGGARVGG